MFTLHRPISLLLVDQPHPITRESARRTSSSASGPTAPGRHVTPLTAWDDSHSAHVEIDVPGVKLEDLNIIAKDGTLRVSGLRRPADAARMLHAEQYFGPFERMIHLNESVDPASIEASLSDGVLHLKMAKRPEAVPQRVAIRNPVTP